MRPKGSGFDRSRVAPAAQDNFKEHYQIALVLLPTLKISAYPYTNQGPGTSARSGHLVRFWRFYNDKVGLGESLNADPWRKPDVGEITSPVKG